MQSIQAAEPVVPTEESQADKGINHTLFTCRQCATVWRSRGYTRCPTCVRDVGTIFCLDHSQCGDLNDAAFDQKKVRPTYTIEQLEHAMGEFRVLLDEYAPWYDRTSRKMIQACHGYLVASGGTSSKVALALHFFKEEWTRASDDEKTFCPEVIQQWVRSHETQRNNRKS